MYVNLSGVLTGGCQFERSPHWWLSVCMKSGMTQFHADLPKDPLNHGPVSPLPHHWQ